MGMHCPRSIHFQRWLGIEGVFNQGFNQGFNLQSGLSLNIIWSKCGSLYNICLSPIVYYYSVCESCAAVGTLLSVSSRYIRHLKVSRWRVYVVCVCVCVCMCVCVCDLYPWTPIARMIRSSRSTYNYLRAKGRCMVNTDLGTVKKIILSG